MTALIILAAGLSTRFGIENKVLADVSGKPLGRHVVDALAPLKFTQKYVVTGKDDLALMDVFAGYTKVINLRPEDGQWRSIRLGVSQALSDGVTRAVVCLADMPLVPTAHYAALLKSDISAMTSVEDVSQPPAIFDHEDLKSLAGLTQGQRGKDVLSNSLKQIALAPHLAVDIDRKTDLAKLL